MHFQALLHIEPIFKIIYQKQYKISRAFSFLFTFFFSFNIFKYLKLSELYFFFFSFSFLVVCPLKYIWDYLCIYCCKMKLKKKIMFFFKAFIICKNKVYYYQACLNFVYMCMYVCLFNEIKSLHNFYLNKLVVVFFFVQ